MRRDVIPPAVFVRIRVGVRIVVGTGQAECTGQAAGTGIAATCTQRTGVAAVSAITTVAIAAKREAADRKAAISAIAAIGVAAVARRVADAVHAVAADYAKIGRAHVCTPL